VVPKWSKMYRSWSGGGPESDIKTTLSLVPKWICTEMDYPVVPNVTGTERDLPRSILWLSLLGWMIDAPNAHWFIHHWLTIITCSITVPYLIIVPEREAVDLQSSVFPLTGNVSPTHSHSKSQYVVTCNCNTTSFPHSLKLASPPTVYKVGVGLLFWF